MPLRHWRSGGGGDVRCFPNNAGTHLVAVAAGGGCEGVLAVGGGPSVDVVADERPGVPGAGYPEVGLVGIHESHHPREGTRGDPENRRAAATVSLPGRIAALEGKNPHG